MATLDAGLPAKGKSSDSARPSSPRGSRDWAAAPLAVLILAPLMRIQPIGDPDTFWHLATGDWLRETWTFTGPDPFGYMAARDWTLHEWLPELLMSYTYSAFGLAGTGLLLPLAIIAIAAAVLNSCRANAGHLVSALVTAIAMFAMVQSLTLRPHLVTFALTAIVTAAWLRTADDCKPRWWLVAVTWVWACSHGMWFVSVVIGVMVTVGIALDRSPTRRELAKLSLIPLLSLAAAALTPVGPTLLMAPLHVSETTEFIDEWRRPNFGDEGFVALVALVAVILVSWMVTKRRLSYTRIGLLLLVGVAGAAYWRTVAVAAAIAAPLAAEALSRAAQLQRPPVLRAELAARAVAAAVAFAVAAIVGAAVWGTTARVPLGLNPSIAKLPSGSTVCNAYGLGGWLIWQHPNVRPAIDGRIEIYTVAHLREYLNFARGVDVDAYLASTSCRYAVLTGDLKAASLLSHRRDWAIIAKADSAVLLGRVSPMTP